MMLALFDWPAVTAMIAVAGVFANAWRQEQERKGERQLFAEYVQQSFDDVARRLQALEVAYNALVDEVDSDAS